MMMVFHGGGSCDGDNADHVGGDDGVVDELNMILIKSSLQHKLNYNERLQ
jgi:hypothetical protein